MTRNQKIAYAKKTLFDFVPRINSVLERIWKRELAVNGIDSEKVQKLVNHLIAHLKEHNLRTAKRLRAAFIYHGFKLFNNDPKQDKKILDAAASIELIHTALLIHDDFMDQDTLRRGKPTTHIYYRDYHKKYLKQGDPAHFGNAISVTLGDTALSMGIAQLNRADFGSAVRQRAMEELMEGIVKTGFGQAFDVYMETLVEATEQDVIDLHSAKTSIYTYKTPLMIGAILAGARQEDLELIEKYAIPGGIAFQLQDDVLGLYGDPEKTGKPAHSDMREGKQTLLIIKAIELGTNEQVNRIAALWGNKNMKTEDAEEIRRIVKESGSLKYSQKVAMRYARESQKFVRQMHKRGWNEEAVNFLDGISEFMAVGRET